MNVSIVQGRIPVKLLQKCYRILPSCYATYAYHEFMKITTLADKNNPFYALCISERM